MAFRHHHQKKLHTRRGSPTFPSPSIQPFQPYADTDSDLYATFNGLRVSPSTLAELSFEQPSPKTMQDLIRIAYRDDNLSPGFIDDIMANLAQNQYVSNDTTWEDPMITEVPQVPGENDNMRGGLVPGDEASRLPLNDHLDCTGDIHEEMTHMKWRILDAQHLALTPGLFQSPEDCYHALGQEFLTTNEGLRRAVEDCSNTGLQGQELDLIVLGALARRGGRCNWKGHRGGQFTEPLFPEDMEPIIDESSDLYDKTYWDDLKSHSIFYD